METYPDIIAVLCAGNPKIEDGVCKWDDYDEGGYLGGHVRMNAAVMLCQNATKGTIILLVGGSDEKVRAMKFYIMKHCDIEKCQVEIIMLKSLPNTVGNLCAIRRYVTEPEFYEGSLRVSQKKTGRCPPETIGLLSNFYHQHRIMLFASDILDARYIKLKVIPLVAETFVPPDYTDPEIHPKFIKRMASELEGLQKWEMGQYPGSKDLDKKYLCQIVEDDNIK